MFADMNEIRPRCVQCGALCTVCHTGVKRQKRKWKKSSTCTPSDDDEEGLPLSLVREDVQPLSRWKEELQGQHKKDEVKLEPGVTWKHGDVGIPDHIIKERTKDGVAEILIVWEDGMLDNASWEKKDDFEQWPDYAKLFEDLAVNLKSKARRSGFKGGKY
jgi:hypothetical protein